MKIQQHCFRKPYSHTRIAFIGGTRFIGVYLARDLINQGHEVTLLTRGKTPITSQIPDDTDATFKSYTDAIKHIAVDRKDEAAVKEKLSSGGFEGATDLPALFWTLTVPFEEH